MYLPDKELYNQLDEEFIAPIRSYGCLFLCMYAFSPAILTKQRLNELWLLAVKKGIIVDNVIQNHNAMCAMLGWNCRYLDKHFPPDTQIEANQKAIACFRWKYTHFVIVDKTKIILYDPLGCSETVKNGTLESLRLYEEV